MRMFSSFLFGTAVVLALGGVARATQGDKGEKRADAVLRASVVARGQAGVDRIEQDEVQKACSRLPQKGPLPPEREDRILATQTETIRYPADGRFMGDWREGEKIAQKGTGLQFSDNPAEPSGGNCYACHRLSGAEIAYGTIGPSLTGFGVERGASEEVQRYVYGKIYNAQAYVACSSMPRFGFKGILTEQQMKDLVALLLDPASPVNQPPVAP